MLAKRIIPCLDVDSGRVKKGVKFNQLRDAGDPVAIAAAYSQQGADELAVLDISASHQGRKTTVQLVEQIATQVFIPLLVGGGISELDDIKNLLRAGADKVSINTAVVTHPQLVQQAAESFGSQCIVAAIDAKKQGDSWQVMTHGGRQPTGLDAIEWAQQLAANGAGEILLTSMDRDGTKQGFDLELVQQISSKVTVPVIASGGVGDLQHLVDGVLVGQADAVLAASIFHFNEHSIASAKQYMHNAGIIVREITE